VGKTGLEAADGSLATSPGEWSWSGSGGEGNRSLGSSLPQGIGAITGELELIRRHGEPNGGRSVEAESGFEVGGYGEEPYAKRRWRAHAACQRFRIGCD